ncbi:MAG: glycosyl transferase family 1 [Leptolyngbya sp. SIOISBB]|nr:glycosyl transferase family 1 [Leptolyngbya sp. SIOISBB]
MCSLGQELQRRGHQVSLFGIPEIQAKIDKANLHFFEIGSEAYPYDGRNSVYSPLGKLSGIAGLKFAVETSEQMTKILFREAPNAIKRAGIDLLLVDQLTAAGGTIANYLNIPFITICNTLTLHQEASIPPSVTDWSTNDLWCAKLRNQLAYQFLNHLTRTVWQMICQQRHAWRLWPYRHREDAYSQLAQICQIPKALDFPYSQLPPWFHYVGPLNTAVSTEDIEAFPFGKLSRKPLIYANLGTLQNRNKDIFQHIADACLEIDAQLVISMGNPKADLSTMHFSGTPMVFAFPPHRELISRSHLVITHAGSTAVTCLSAGVPMVAIPISMDQPGMAARLARAGAAEIIPLAKLDIPYLRRAIQTVLDQDTYRHNAIRLSNDIKASGGVCLAADIVEQVAANNAPALNELNGKNQDLKKF